MCALPRRPGATELCYIIGGRRGRRCSYAVTAVQPKVLPPLHRDGTLHQLLLSPQALSGSRGRAAAAGANGKPAVRRSMSARPAASAERARLAKRVSMAGILEAGSAGGAMHGFVSTEGILSKIRAKMQAKERGDNTPTRHDFLFSKADRACMAGQLRQAHDRDGVRACRQSLPRLSPAHSDEDAIPWVLEEQDPYGKLPMRRCGHSVRFCLVANLLLTPGQIRAPFFPLRLPLLRTRALAGALSQTHAFLRRAFTRTCTRPHVHTQACVVGTKHVVVFGGCDDRKRPFNDIHILDC